MTYEKTGKSKDVKKKKVNVASTPVANMRQKKLSDFYSDNRKKRVSVELVRSDLEIFTETAQ